jgi:hypothetical protein
MIKSLAYATTTLALAGAFLGALAERMTRSREQK